MSKVAIICGGKNEQRNIANKSAKFILPYLEKLGYETVLIDFDVDTIIKKLEKINPDIVFNSLHGIYGEDGRLQSLLDILKIPYTHSLHVACVISENKYYGQCVYKAAGLNVPDSFIVTREMWEDTAFKTNIELPFIIKPSTGGCSHYLQFIDNFNSIQNLDFDKVDQFIFQQYIKGRELTVGIFDNKIIGVTEVKPYNGKIFDTESKYNKKVEYNFFPNLSEDERKKVEETALKVHQSLDCRGITRIDMILNEKSEPYVLELNANPGFTKQSIYPQMILNSPYTIEEVLNYLIKTASYNN